MSADNAIALLVTRDMFCKTTDSGSTLIDSDGRNVWRVAHIGNPEEFDHYKITEPHNLGWWMDAVFGKASTYLDEVEAFDAAIKMHDSMSFVEHGVVTFEARPLNFPGC